MLRRGHGAWACPCSAGSPRSFHCALRPNLRREGAALLCRASPNHKYASSDTQFSSPSDSSGPGSVGPTVSTQQGHAWEPALVSSSTHTDGPNPSVHVEAEVEAFGFLDSHPQEDMLNSLPTSGFLVHGSSDKAHYDSSSAVPAQASYSDFYRSQNTALHSHSAPSTTVWDPPHGSAGTSSSGSSSGSAALSVEEALARAQRAIDQAESSLSGVEQLPSAQPKRPQYDQAVRVARSAAGLGLLSFAVVASHAFGLAAQWAGAVAIATAVAAWGFQKRSLSQSGAIAAMLLGCGTLGCSMRFGSTLLAFFIASSKLTQYQQELKQGLEEDFKAGGQRSWAQVLCNGLLPTCIAIAYGVFAGCVDVPLGPSPHLDPPRARLLTLLQGAFLGYCACCCGDTWASEIGSLSSSTPRLITSLRPVRPGTNGGVTLLGLAASTMGGLFVGLVFYASAIISPTLWILEAQRPLAAAQWKLIPLGLAAGLLGSALDSLLGATLQFTGYNRATQRITTKPGPDVTHIAGLPMLDNNMVNAVSATATSFITAAAALKLFGL